MILHDKGKLLSFGWMSISKENNHLLTVMFPQLRCWNIAGADSGRAWVLQSGKALLSCGGFCHLPCVPPVIDSSVNFLLWFSIADLQLLGVIEDREKNP